MNDSLIYISGLVMNFFTDELHNPFNVDVVIMWKDHWITK